MPPTEATVRSELAQVIDPEVGIDIVALGLVYAIDVASEAITVQLTMTSPACPFGVTLVEEARDRLRALAPNATISVDLVWDPPWHPGLMSDAARARLGWRRI